jgi:hypothetical protein
VAETSACLFFRSGVWRVEDRLRGGQPARAPAFAPGPTELVADPRPGFERPAVASHPGGSVAPRRYPVDMALYQRRQRQREKAERVARGETIPLTTQFPVEARNALLHAIADNLPKGIVSNMEDYDAFLTIMHRTLRGSGNS